MWWYHLYLANIFLCFAAKICALNNFMTKPTVFLIDNGSLRPQATFWLRCLAEALSERTGYHVEAVSLLHSHKIDPEMLDGVPATIVKRRLRELAKAGEVEFVFLPLFLGPSLGVQDYLPQVIEEVSAEHPKIRVKIADVLSGSDPDSPDPRLARILAEQVRAMRPSSETKVALVDHGTPAEVVNRVRNRVAQQLADELGATVAMVQPCSMERREGEAYAFNEPLIENLAQVPSFAGGDLILAMFFLLPGRHAGEGGDVAEIYADLIEDGTFASIETTPLLAESPKLLDILEDRLQAVQAAL